MIDRLRKLAKTLDAEWQFAGYKPRAFPDIAARLLQDFEPRHNDYPNALADWVLDSKTFPAACNPFGPLGPPAFTVWSNERFFVNIYAYTRPEVVIHDHNFAGAFVNLSGQTIHCTYRFDASEPVDPSVRTGELKFANLESIGERDVRRIDPGAGFVHQVWHISSPTVVLVIRTPALSRRTVRQFEYFRPSISTEIVRDQTLALGAPARFQYARKMMECLRGSGGEIPYLARLVVRERPWDAVWHLVENWRFLRTSGAFEDIIRKGAKHHGEWFLGVQPAATRAGLFYSIDWRRVETEQDRIVMALLVTLDSWQPICTALQALLPGRAPHEIVLESLRRLGEQYAIPLGLPDDRLAILACVLRSRSRPEQWKRACASPSTLTIAAIGAWSGRSSVNCARKSCSGRCFSEQKRLRRLGENRGGQEENEKRGSHGSAAIIKHEGPRFSRPFGSGF